GVSDISRKVSNDTPIKIGIRCNNRLTVNIHIVLHARFVHGWLGQCKFLPALTSRNRRNSARFANPPQNHTYRLYPTFFPLSQNMPPSTFSRMNVFVTGGAGYIGSVCVEELL